MEHQITLGLQMGIKLEMARRLLNIDNTPAAREMLLKGSVNLKSLTLSVMEEVKDIDKIFLRLVEDRECTRDQLLGLYDSILGEVT